MKYQGLAKASIGFLLCMTVAGTLRAEAPPPESKLPKLVGDVLWWLPEDTQTVIVTQGPFQIDIPDKNARGDSLGLERTLQLTNRGIPVDRLDRDAMKRLCRQSIALTVEGSRRFRCPTGLGSMRYEGAHVVVFKEALGPDGEALMASLRRTAKETQTISGVNVIVLEEKLERDLWSIYRAHPKPDTLIFATDRAYLSSMLDRMAKRPATRALPTTLPEWNLLDQNARIWAIRHYDRNDALADSSSPVDGTQKSANVPDDQAIGLVFWVDPRDGNSAKLKYLSTNKDALDIAGTLWGKQGAFKRTVRQESPGVVDISISTQSPNGERDVEMFLFFLQAYLGHGIYL